MPRLLLCSCQLQPWNRHVVVPDVYQQPRSRTEPLPVARMQMSHHGIGGSCNRLFFSISSLLASRGLGNDAAGTLVRELPGAERHQNLSICSLWWCRRMSHRFTCASTGTTKVHKCQHVSCLDPAFQFEVVSSHHVHWRCLLGVSMAIHSKSRGKHTCSSAQLPTNTCATYRTLEWRNRSLCWIHAIFILIHERCDDPRCRCPGWFSRFGWLRVPLMALSTESSLTPQES